MFQTDQATAASSLPTPAAAGTPGYFTNGNPASGVAATILDADFMNMLMMELSNVVTGAGIALSKTTYTQVLSAIRRIAQNTVVLADTGAANAYTAANATPLVAGTWMDGVVQQVKIAHANTGASTYAPDSLAAIPIYGLGLQPLQGGELAIGGTAVLMHATISGVNSGNPICVLMECAGGSQQVAPGTQSQHAMQIGQAIGRLLNVQRFTSSGTYTPTSGTTSIVVDVQAAGGGSGTANAAATGAGGGGGSGGGGCFARARISSGFSGVAVTIGAGGLAGTTAPQAGGNGGASSFGTLVSCPGGLGGGAGGSSTTAQVSQGGGSSSQPTVNSPAVLVFQKVGNAAGPTIVGNAGATVFTGNGGDSFMGEGAYGQSAGAAGRSPSLNSGGGASAAASPSGTGPFSGAPGGAGLVIVYEYA